MIALKTIITDKSLIEAISNAVLEEKNPDSEDGGGNDNGGEEDFDDLGGDMGGGGGGGDLMDTISDIGTDNVTLGEEGEGAEDLGTEGGDEGEGDELPAVGDLVDQESIDTDSE